MALLFMDGWAGGDSNFKWDAASDTITSQSATPRVAGGYYGRFSSQSTFKSFPAASKIILGFGMQFISSSSVNSSVGFYGDAGVTRHISVMRDGATGLLQIRRGLTNGTLLATGTQQLAKDQWNYIEVSVTISDTIGEVHVRLNGSTTDEVSYVGDTKNAGTATTIDKIDITSGAALVNIADVYILNNSGATNNNFLGDVAVRTLAPNNNGTYSQLVGSDGNSTDNYLLVDERPYSATDYVGSATAGQKDLYQMADLPVGVSTVYGMQVSGAMVKSDATAASARLLMRTGGVDYNGVTRGLTTTSTGYYELYENNPGTATAWTTAQINSVEAGMEVQ